MHAYNEAYLDDVVENQGKLFDFIATNYPDKDTEEFIKAYMSSKTRQSIDESQLMLILCLQKSYGIILLKRKVIN